MSRGAGRGGMLESDAEADASVAAFFARVVRPIGLFRAGFRASGRECRSFEGNLRSQGQPPVTVICHDGRGYRRVWKGLEPFVISRDNLIFQAGVEGNAQELGEGRHGRTSSSRV